MISITIPARLEYLGLLRAVVEALGQLYDAHPHRPTATVLYAWSLAVYEAGTNIVMHGHDGGAPASFSLRIDPGLESVAFELEDCGRPNERWGHAPQASDEDEHGRGLAIIRHVMDEATYLCGPDGRNVLRLVALLEPAAARTGSPPDLEASPSRPVNC
jgi:anti-sigma regulatory factor (Ser/Thr protein kinase)